MEGLNTKVDLDNTFFENVINFYAFGDHEDNDEKFISF